MQVDCETLQFVEMVNYFPTKHINWENLPNLTRTVSIVKKLHEHVFTFFSIL